MTWLAQAYAKLGLPFWLGAATTAVVPFSALGVLDYLFVPYDIVDGSLGVAAFSAYVFYLLFAAHFTSKKVEDPLDYSKSMSLDPTVVKPGSGHHLPGTLLIMSMLAGALSLVGGLPPPALVFQEHTLSVSYLLLILSYLIWVYGVSMLAIHRMGKLPLRLKPYTEIEQWG